MLKMEGGAERQKLKLKVKLKVEVKVARKGFPFKAESRGQKL